LKYLVCKGYYEVSDGYYFNVKNKRPEEMYEKVSDYFQGKTLSWYARSKSIMRIQEKIDVVERDAFIPVALEKEIRENILKKKAILATDISVKYDIRVSAIKLLLKQYEEEGLIKLLDPSLKLKIYVPS